MKVILNIIALVVLTSILFYLIYHNSFYENFSSGIFGWDPLTLPHRCTPENNCFPGHYARTQIYHNMCQPSSGLLRQKIGLQDNCQRSLDNYFSKPNNQQLKCTVDKHLQRRCQWVSVSS